MHNVPPLASSDLAKNFGADEIGWKAVGLAKLPDKWVPRFFVLTVSAYRLWRQTLAEDDPAGRWPLSTNVVETALRGISCSNQSILIRSSGVGEDLESRGRYESHSILGTFDAIRETASEIWLQTSNNVDSGSESAPEMALIIQQAINPKLKGHLSNERRVSSDSKEWLIEIEQHQGVVKSNISRFKLKQSDRLLAEGIPSCKDHRDLKARLKELAVWAIKMGTRAHFEWVWDERRLWVVQYDQERKLSGIAPGKSWNAPLTVPQITTLNILREAENAIGPWKKITSLRTLRRCGLPTAKIYVLEHPKVLTGLSKDKVSAKLRSDLKQLLAIAVVIRSDIKAPSADFPALSPRTETLSELDHVIAFLISQAKAFTQSGLGPDDFCFLIHHYIPARSGAYSLSRPRNPRVRIDSTWGVPDSLLAYPHDSFEIDTSRDTPIRCLLRCKTTFIDTDERGKWIPCSCAESHDWAPSLTDIEIKEIAQYSVKLSTHLHKAVEIMFFVGVDSRSGHPSCLPWLIVEDVPDFEKQTEEFHYAGNYFLVDTEISLLHAESWIQKQKQRTKVYLKLRPRVELLRSKKFISDVASFATKHAIPVELEGSVLQHIYYLLRKAGIRVKCTEAFQEQPSRRRFGKLVRDLIPVKIQRHGETARVLRLSKEELLPMLKAKAIEEAFELFWEADPARMLEELADILEVIRSTCSILGRSESDLETVANSKKLERGGFEEGLILIETKEEPLLGAETQEALFHSDSNQGMASHKDLPQIPHVWLRKDTVHMSIVPPVGGTTTFRFPITDLGMEAVVTYKSKEVRLALKPFAPAESPNQLTFDFA